MENEVLWNILAKPEDAKYAFTLNAQALVDQAPQSGLFRALLAANGNEENVRHAAVRFNPAILYKLIHAPESLPKVSADQLYAFEAPLVNGSVRKPAANIEPEQDNSHSFHQLNSKPAQHEELPYWKTKDEDEDAVNQDIDAAEGKEESLFRYDKPADEPVAYIADEEDDEPTYDNPWQEEKIETPAARQQPVADVQVAEQPQPVAETQPPVAEVEQPVAQPEPVAQNAAPAPQPELIPLSEQTEYFHQDIDDEIYDEIVSIDDIGMEFINSYKPTAGYADEEEKINSSHFAFDGEFSGTESENEALSQNAQPANYAHHEEIEDIKPYVPPVIVPANEIVVLRKGVSQYHDDNLPYSFMWWLEKTRQQHSGAYNYQPYSRDNSQQQNPRQQAQPSPDLKLNTDTATGRDMLDELQIQYVENIYTLNAVDDLQKRKAPRAEENQTKEDQIIDRFIKTEPHIKPPNDAKLDSENKAKRSSEDGDELITETLARIYAEQMLYSKAIAAYKKLMLKYPEKSLYFAGQIEQLEKKPN
jgi:hypothetical protein